MFTPKVRGIDRSNRYAVETLTININEILCQLGQFLRNLRLCCVLSLYYKHVKNQWILRCLPLGQAFCLFAKKMLKNRVLFYYFLLTHEGLNREAYQEFQPNHDIFLRWCQGLFRPQVPCTPSLHCPIDNSYTGCKTANKI